MSDLASNSEDEITDDLTDNLITDDMIIDSAREAVSDQADKSSLFSATDVCFQLYLVTRPSLLCRNR